MQTVVWILRLAIVLVLVWFAVKNGQDVTLTGAERILLFATGADGTTWLVPAYRFTTADGTGPIVVAVDDRFLGATGVTPTGR
jgi:hypothetical protein